MIKFIERVLYKPKGVDYIIILVLMPLSVVYASIMYFRRKFAKRVSYSVPIISVGNIVAGGAGKTPMVITLAKRYRDIAIISRGYGRKSRGLRVVSKKGEILSSVDESGDEPMLMAKSIPNSTVIVSENRHQGIKKAIKEGAKIIFLDDGFNRVDIEKFEILLEPDDIKNPFPLPAGGYREFKFVSKSADLILKEGIDFKRVVRVENQKERMVLVTAISRPERLEPFLPRGVVGRYYLPDHSDFDKEKLVELLNQFSADSILVTEKDFVKISNFKLEISLLRLELDINQKYIDSIDNYIRTFNEKKD